MVTISFKDYIDGLESESYPSSETMYGLSIPTEGEVKKNIIKFTKSLPQDFLDSIMFDKPLVKVALVAASTFEHSVPLYSELPSACPNRYIGEGDVASEVNGISRELEGHRPPFDDNTYKVWRQIYEKLRDISENPESINFLDYTQGTVDNGVNWEDVEEKDGFNVTRTEKEGSYISFSIPDEYENCMIIYSKRVDDGGVGSITINDSAPSTYPLYANSKMAEFDPPNNPTLIKADDTIEFSRIQGNATYDNGTTAICCHQVISGLTSIEGSKTLKITADDSDGMTIWGVAYWNGTFIWAINASRGGRSMIGQILFVEPEIVVPSVDYVISQSFGINIISEGRTVEQMLSSMETYYNYCKANGIDVCYMSYQPFGKQYITNSQWINSNGVNYQDYDFLAGKPSEVEENYVTQARNMCNYKGYPYIPVYEAFEKIILKSSDPDITTGETMGQLYQSDGQHLRQAGVDVFVRVISQYLNI